MPLARLFDESWGSRRCDFGRTRPLLKSLTRATGPQDPRWGRPMEPQADPHPTPTGHAKRRRGSIDNVEPDRRPDVPESETKEQHGLLDQLSSKASLPRKPSTGSTRPPVRIEEPHTPGLRRDQERER